MTLRSRSLVFLTLLFGLLAGCEAGGPAAPELAAPPATAPSATLEDGSYTLVEAGLPLVQIDKSGWIGADGGALHLSGHAIDVPAGAVKEPTLFTMTRLAGDKIELELLALEIDPLLGSIDVGSNGFADGKRVRLTMSYAGARNVSDPDRLRILRLKDDGTVEELPTTVDRASRTVSADLEHFSRYCMAID